MKIKTKDSFRLALKYYKTMIITHFLNFEIAQQKIITTAFWPKRNGSGQTYKKRCLNSRQNSI